MPTDAEVFAVKRAREGEIMNRSNVYAVGIGPKFTGGTPTGELAICVMVVVKLPPGVLPPADVLPQAYDGVKTDVIAMAPAVPHSTVKGGVRLGVRSPDDHPPAHGTLGCVARTAGVGLGQPPDVLVSNWHVLYNVDPLNRPFCQPGDPVFLPSCTDCCEPVVAKVGIADTTIDAAIAPINAGHNVQAMLDDKAITGTVDFHPPNWASVPPDTFALFRGGTYRVWKKGATTDWTKGLLRCVDLAIPPVFPNTRTAYHVAVKPIGAKKDFSLKGDSGSVIVDDRMRVVALLWGGPSHHGADDDARYTFGFPISLVEKSLKIRIATNPPVKVWRIPGDTPLTDLHRDLAMTQAGRDLLSVYGRHEREVGELLRTRRFIVAWHRNNGPAFVRALFDLANGRTTALWTEDDFGSWRDGVERIVHGLRGLVSPALEADIRRWASMAADIGGCTYREVVDRIGARG